MANSTKEETGIESISRSQLTSLAEMSGPYCVSIYMPAPRAGEETRQSPVRLKVLLRDARERLEQSGADSRVTAALLKPFEALIDDYQFWQHQYGGLGLFSCDGFFRSHKLSYPVSEEVIAGNRFYLKPLLPMWADDGEFLLLALSKNSVRLFRANRHALVPIPIGNVPQSEAEALKFDDPEKSLQVHAGSPGSQGVPTGITHGHGAAREESKERTLRFFQHVDRGLKPYLSNEKAPLLLAGVDYYLPLYREANSYPHLLESVVSGSPEEGSDGNLLKAAWETMEPYFQRTREQSFAAITQGIANGKATNDLEKAVAAACQGRADKCFVSLDTHQWGFYDPDTAKVQLLDQRDKRAVDLLDLAAAETLSKGGEVFPVPRSHEVPGRGPIAILNRY